MDDKALELTADVVTAFLSHNATAVSDLPGLMQAVHRAFREASTGVGGSSGQPAAASQPAVPIRRSITADYLICLEDGRRFRSLKRHLRAEHNLSPANYRTKWGLDNDYPMVARNYSERRSTLAKAIGLGTSTRRPAEPVQPELIETKAKRKGRRKSL